MKNNREWLERTLAHEECDAVPYNFLFSPRALRAMEDHYGKDFLDSLSFPIRMGSPLGRKPLYADPDKYGPTIQDDYGVVWTTNPIDRGAPIGPCITESTLKGYTFPDPTQEWRFQDLGAWCARNDGHYRILWVGALWEQATFMRGMEGLLLDVALHPAFVEALLDGIANWVLKTTEILLARFPFECIAVSDDYGTQRAMIISPADWRRFIKPRLKQIYALAKRQGRACFHHSCGHIIPVIPDLIEIGLDILHPIQPEAMDIARLKKEFGKDLTFCGGVRTQDFLPRASPDEVRQEVRRLKREMGRGGGYILEPGITILADVPPANIYALVDEARVPGR